MQQNSDLQSLTGSQSLLFTIWNLLYFFFAFQNTIVSFIPFAFYLQFHLSPSSSLIEFPYLFTDDARLFLFLITRFFWLSPFQISCLWLFFLVVTIARFQSSKFSLTTSFIYTYHSTLIYHSVDEVKYLG